MTIKQEIDAKLADNVTQLITPHVLREVLHGMNERHIGTIINDMAEAEYSGNYFSMSKVIGSPAGVNGPMVLFVMENPLGKAYLLVEPTGNFYIGHKASADTDVTWHQIPILPGSPGSPVADGDYVLKMVGGIHTWVPFTATGGVSSPPLDQDKDYIVSVNNGVLSWIEAPAGSDLPDAPTADGEYVLHKIHGVSLWTAPAPVKIMPLLPSVPAAPGDYVLGLISGSLEWVAQGAAAAPLDAYVLGSTLTGDITMSIYHKFDGLAEETRNSGVDLIGYDEHIVHPMYQSGMTSAHIGDTSLIFMALRFGFNAAVALVHGTGVSVGNQMTGAELNAIIAAGQDIKTYVEIGTSSLLFEIV